MKYLMNAFSLNMLPIEDSILIKVKKIESTQVPEAVYSAIGHQDTATIVSAILGFDVAFNRISVSLKRDDIVYVCQYKGPRLPEGATKLPEGATIDFFEITFENKEYNNGCYLCSD